MKKAFFLLYIFVIAGCIFDADEASESSTSSGSQNPKLVMAYYENWRQYRESVSGEKRPSMGYYTPSDIPWSKLDYVFYAFGDIRAYTDSSYSNKASGELIRILDKYQGSRYKSIEKVVWENQSYFSTETNRKVLDAVKGFALMPGVDGESSPEEDYGTKDIYDFLENAETNGVKPIISVGGWNFNDVNVNSNGNHWPTNEDLTKLSGSYGHHTAWIFTTMCSKSKFRKSFVESVVHFLDTVKTSSGYGFCGIDFDWEYPGLPAFNKNYDGSNSYYDDLNNFAKLITELRSALPEDIIITASVPSDAYNKAVGYYWPTMVKNLDWINLMCYDYYGFANEKVLLPNAPLFVSDPTKLSVNKTVKQYEDLGVPLSKMMLGLATYGRGWKNIKGDYEIGYEISPSPLVCNAGPIGFLAYQSIV